MNELVEYEPRTPVEANARRRWVELMRPAADLAKSIAGTDFVKSAIRGNPAAIAACVLYGDEVGLGPMQALAQISVIDGRPALSAEAMRALILAAGHDLWIEESSVTKATIAGKRRDSQQTSRVTWTMDDAKRANLAGKPNWRAYPRQMLAARATAELARLIFADAIGGLLVVEELEETEPSSAPKRETRKRENGQTRKREETTLTRSSRPQRAPEPDSDLPPLPNEPGYDPDAPALESERRKMHALFRESGITERPARLDVASAVLGRRIGSTKEMSGQDVARVIASLRRAESASTERSESATTESRSESETSEASAGSAPETLTRSIFRARLAALGIDESVVQEVGREVFPGRSLSTLEPHELETLLDAVKTRSGADVEWPEAGGDWTT